MDIQFRIGEIVEQCGEQLKDLKIRLTENTGTFLLTGIGQQLSLMTRD